STAPAGPREVISTKELTVIAEPGTLLEPATGSVNMQLIKGTILARAHAPLELAASGATVKISRDAVALVKVTDHFLKIVNLTDSTSNSIQVHIGTDAMSLTPGREIVLSDRAPSLAHIFDVHQI